jgi:penicillin-binding protein 1C
VNRRALVSTLARWLVPRARRQKIELALALFLSPILFFSLAAALTPLPPALADVEATPDASTVFLDRHGKVLCETRAKDGMRARPVRVGEVGDRVVRAVLAAEDKRFFLHPGVDPISITRATFQAVFARRVVSGASTITQQLARTLVPRPRTFVGKLREMALAIRIEASLSKDRILEEYLNRVAFGPSLRGVAAASRFYFDKEPRDLSLAEAAAIASLPRGPTLYDPRRGTERLQRRRDRVLERLRGARLATSDDVDRALHEPLVLAPRGSGLGIPHLRRALLTGAIPTPAGPLAGRAATVTTTIDRGLQREVEILAAQTIDRLASRNVSAASVVVLDNATGEILAYVGSPDIENVDRLGHNDGVLASRQPGSALKPFLYGLGMEIASLTAATVLPDVDLHFPTAEGDYHPNNYDGRFHGPVRVREALASSFNVPAVVVASRIGPERLLTRLRESGFSSLTRSARDYGLALALGDGEVRLLELAAAYATLARGGLSVSPLPIREAKTANGETIPIVRPTPGRIFDPRIVFVLTNILADRHARIATFGEGSVLELPFPVAAKTGTSKGYRDNVTVGFTPNVTVAVWVGNFDGSPMSGVSGVTGAGPLFHDVMLAASRLFSEEKRQEFERPEGLVDVDICPLSGGRPTSACPHRRTELVLRGADLPTCTMHERIRVDRRNGLRAGPACTDSIVESRTFEVFPSELGSWAENASRPLAPRGSSPFCPTNDDAQGKHGDRVRIAFPTNGSRFVRDTGLSAPEAIHIRIDAPAGARKIRLFINGHAEALTPPFERPLPLVPGEHVLYVEADGVTSDRVTFTVE